MDSHLQRLRQELEDATRDASDNDLLRSAEGKWNSAQILEHLFLTYKGTNQGMARCLEKNVPLATRATLFHRAATFLTVNLGYMVKGRKAPEKVVPRGLPPGNIRREIGPELQRMSAGLDECERRFGPSTKLMDHLILGPLTAGQWRKFHWVHGQHHARQIRERLAKDVK
jgi:hypothetical protein